MDIIYALLFDESGKSRPIEGDELEHWTPDDGVLCVHLDANDPETADWIASRDNIPPLIPEALTATETRPRSQTIDDGLLLVLRGVNTNPGADPEDMVSLRLWVQESRIITSRRRKLLSISDTVDSLTDHPCRGTTDVLWRIVDRLLFRINEAIDQAEEVAADLESDVMDEASQSLRSRLSGQRRETIALRRYLGPQREALGRLSTQAPAWFSETDKMVSREYYDRLVRLVEDLDAVRERASVTHEELVSRLSDQLNQRMYLLSIVAALFLPMGFLTGLLGINVGGIPGSDNPYAFWVFVVLLVAALSVQIWLFRRNKWF